MCVNSSDEYKNILGENMFLYKIRFYFDINCLTIIGRNKAERKMLII